MNEKASINKTPLLLGAIIVSLSSSAQKQQDSTGIAKNNEAIKQQVTELSKTNAHHQLLASTAGEWSFTGKHTFPNPAIKPFEFKGTAVKGS